MEKTNLNEFLKENNAIFSYLRDDNGNKIGVILAVPGENEPKIGYAFFSEVVPTSDTDSLYEPLFYIGDLPNFEREISRITGGKPSSIGKIELPLELIAHRFRPDMINRNDTIFLARQRANTNRDHFYVTSNFDDPQHRSELYHEHPMETTVIYGIHMDPNYCGRVYKEVDEINYISCKAMRKQIRDFEYRALRYYKYIPGYKDKH